MSSKPSPRRILKATQSLSVIIAIRICSVPIRSESNFLASEDAFSSILFALGVYPSLSLTATSESSDTVKFTELRTFSTVIPLS